MFGTVESVKAVSDLFAPISPARSSKVNDAAPRRRPRLLNQDPYQAMAGSSRSSSSDRASRLDALMSTRRPTSELIAEPAAEASAQAAEAGAESSGNTGAFAPERAAPLGIRGRGQLGRIRSAQRSLSGPRLDALFLAHQSFHEVRDPRRSAKWNPKVKVIRFERLIDQAGGGG